MADCGADIYEHLQQCQAQGLGFVVHVAQDRALVAGPTKTPAGYLFKVTRTQFRAGTFTLALWGRPRQPACEVVFAGKLQSCSDFTTPQRLGEAKGKSEPVLGSVVRI